MIGSFLIDGGVAGAAHLIDELVSGLSEGRVEVVLDLVLRSAHKYLTYLFPFVPELPMS